MNHSDNITRIIDILKDDITIFELNVPDKLRKIIFGNPPQNKASLSPMIPCAYVTTLQSLQKIHPQFGHSSGADLPDKTDYAIILVSSGSDTETAQKKLYDLEFNVKKVLEADRLFKDPTNDDDPKFTRSVIVDTYRDSSLFGGNIETITIVLQAESGDVNTITIGTDAELENMPILDRPAETHIENYENVYSTSRDKVTMAPINHDSIFFVKIEYSDIVWNKLQDIRDTRDIISFTITRSGVSQVRNGKLTHVNNGAGYDEVETILVQIGII